MRRSFAALMFMSLCWSLPAHPHIWIDGSIDLQFDGAGLSGLEVRWAFDDFNSADMILHFDTNGDFTLSADEVRSVRERSFDHLFAIDYFMLISVDGRQIEPPAATAFDAAFEGGRLIYSFVTPVRVAWRDLDTLSIALFDQSYYIAFQTNATRARYSSSGAVISAARSITRMTTDGWGTVRVAGIDVDVER